MIDIYAVRTTEVSGCDVIGKMLEFVSEKKRTAMQRYRYPEDALRSLLGEVLARMAICSRLNVANEQLSFGVNDFKKPLLLYPEGYDFNISHAGQWVVCALSPFPVGIDVEYIKPINLEIAESVLDRQEYEWFLHRPIPEKLFSFYRLWTLKESYIKAIGKGLYIPLKSFGMNITEEDDILLSSEDASANAQFIQHRLDDEHVMAVCSLGPRNEYFSPVRHLNYYDFSLLLDSFLCEKSNLDF